MNNKQYKAKDSYQEFLDSFEIDKESLYQWGISATIFPPIETVTAAWYNLKERIFTNQKVYIRGYGRDAHGTQLYKDLYRVLFGNSHIEKDPTNNAIPQRHIEQLTHLRRNADLYNYQVSHIWGHTKKGSLRALEDIGAHGSQILRPRKDRGCDSRRKHLGDSLGHRKTE